MNKTYIVSLGDIELEASDIEAARQMAIDYLRDIEEIADSEIREA